MAFGKQYGDSGAFGSQVGDKRYGDEVSQGTTCWEMYEYTYGIKKSNSLNPWSKPTYTIVDFTINMSCCCEDINEPPETQCCSYYDESQDWPEQGSGGLAPYKIVTGSRCQRSCDDCNPEARHPGPTDTGWDPGVPFDADCPCDNNITISCPLPMSRRYLEHSGIGAATLVTYYFRGTEEEIKEFIQKCLRDALVKYTGFCGELPTIQIG